jgi:DNA-binding NarL/FixJ family response regulator
MTIKLGIIEDSPYLRDIYEKFFAKCNNFEVVFSVPDWKNLYQGKNAEQPDIILLDLALPSGNSLQFIHKITQLFPYARIVVLSGMDDPETAQTAIANGARGFLLKSSSMEFIKDALEKTYQGGTPLSPAIVNHLINLKTQQAMPGQDHGLTKRELDLCNLVITGMSNKMIAATMNIAFFTVNQHLKHIYKKLNINSKGELIAYLMKS